VSGLVGRGALAVVFVWLAAAGTLASCSRAVLFPHAFCGRYFDAAAEFDKVESRLIEDETGEAVELFVFEGEPGRTPVLYFHGNGGFRALVARRLDAFRTLSGRTAYAPVYSGYGRSEGEPGEAALMADARAALGVYRAETAIDAPLLYGLSMGTGVAARLAEEEGAGALVLEAPFASLPAAVKSKVPFLPARLLVRDRLATVDRIAAVGAPLLVLHGTADRVVPFSQGERVFAAAAEPKRFVAFEGGGHSDLWEAHDAVGEAARFFDAVEGAEADAAARKTGLD